jgi:serine/threonine-protein kinase HipA
MVFNYLGYNNDDHTKNFSFTMDKKGLWKLSPSYDMSYSTGREALHTMSINGVRKNARLSDFGKMAENFNVNDWKTIVKETCDCLKEWETLAAKTGLPQKNRTIVNQRIQENVNRVIKDLSSGREV